MPTLSLIIKIITEVFRTLGYEIVNVNTFICGHKSRINEYRSVNTVLHAVFLLSIKFVSYKENRELYQSSKNTIQWYASSM